MRAAKIVSGAVILLLAVGCLIFGTLSWSRGMTVPMPDVPTPHTFVPAYHNEGLLIVLAFIVGLSGIPIGTAFLGFGVKTRD